MGKSYRYFMIPMDQVPKDPTYPVWFGTWSSKTQEVTWSRDRPDATAWAVAVSAQELTPDGKPSDVAAIDASSGGITNLGVGTKDPPPPPFAIASPSPSALLAAFKQWITARNA